MKIGDEIRRKDDHSTTSRVIDIQVNYARGYGFGVRIKIYNGIGEMWVPMSQWEVINK